MGIMDKILQLLNERNLNQKDLTDFLCIDKSTFTAWKNGKSKSYNKYIYEIAEFFGVSTDYILGRTDDPVDYEDDILIANIPEEILNHFDGDVKAAYKAWKSRTEPDSTELKIPEEIVILNRAAKKMTPEKLQQLLEVAKVMFKEEFND